MSEQASPGGPIIRGRCTKHHDPSSIDPCDPLDAATDQSHKFFIHSFSGDEPPPNPLPTIQIHPASPRTAAADLDPAASHGLPHSRRPHPPTSPPPHHKTRGREINRAGQAAAMAPRAWIHPPRSTTSTSASSPHRRRRPDRDLSRASTRQPDSSVAPLRRQGP